jgi:hypothetical protein
MGLKTSVPARFRFCLWIDCCRAEDLSYKVRCRPHWLRYVNKNNLAKKRPAAFSHSGETPPVFFITECLWRE